MAFKVNDFYAKKAKKENFLARSIYKLEEIDKKYQVIKKNMQVLDLGYYPGSWIQYSSVKIGPTGLVVGVDIQEIRKEIAKMQNVRLMCRDIAEFMVLEDFGVERPFDAVVSDMAPSTTGIKLVDQEKSLQLVEKVIELLPLVLKPGGNFVAKIFEGKSCQEYVQTIRMKFAEFHQFRPNSTRKTSKEVFLIGKTYKS